MISDSINRVFLPNKVWNAVLDETTRKMYLDTRNENGEIVLVQLDLSTLKHEFLKVSHSKWTQLLSSANDLLYFVEYKNEKDPNLQTYFTLDWGSREKKELDTVPKIDSTFYQPSIYEHGSDYHKTVSQFLSLDLALACEYLEWNDKIIISYYLRSDNAFERYLLLLHQGAKVWKICQDNQMRGFSPGSFFVFEEQLIFIKDQNEVCLYTG